MTRINLVDPSHLTSKHLMAEYHELPRIFTAVRKLEEAGKELPAIPANYTLGKGHVIFFYNKIGFLLRRYKAIAQELNEREFNLDIDKYLSIVNMANSINRSYRQPYQPKPEEIYLNMARLVKRSNLDRPLQELQNE